MKQLAYVAFEAHICCWHIYDNSMLIISCNLLLCSDVRFVCEMYVYQCSSVTLLVEVMRHYLFNLTHWSAVQPPLLSFYLSVYIAVT